MDQRATGHFADRTWDETTVVEHGAGKLARAEVTYHYTGDLVGQSTLTYLMTYDTEGTGSFLGFELVTGELGGRAGTFVLRHDGVFDATAARARVTVVGGSGTGDLAGLTGEGSLVAAYEGGPHPFHLDWQLETDLQHRSA